MRDGWWAVTDETMRVEATLVSVVVMVVGVVVV